VAIMAKDVYVERGGVVLTRSKLGLGSGWGGILLGGEGIAAVALGPQLDRSCSLSG